MAKLKTKNANFLCKIRMAMYDLALRSDGSILKNGGLGWKQFKQFKKGLSTEVMLQSFQKIENQEFATAFSKWNRLLLTQLVRETQKNTLDELILDNVNDRYRHYLCGKRTVTTEDIKLLRSCLKFTQQKGN